ncbi:MAG: NfeD family protein [Muribaculaceae bacterium]|nr:NfeD family protein [Muribaculaceae bacterium]
MIQYFAENMWQLWAIVAILCLILELSSGDFFLMCFSIGSVVSMLAALVGGNITVQVITFAVASALCLLFVRPVALKYLHKKKNDRPSNAEAIIGRQGRVSERIEANGFGRVAIDGDDWKSCTTGGKAIEKGSRVRVTAMESIILTVEPVEDDKTED